MRRFSPTLSGSIGCEKRRRIGAVIGTSSSPSAGDTPTTRTPATPGRISRTATAAAATTTMPSQIPGCSLRSFPIAHHSSTPPADRQIATAPRAPTLNVSSHSSFVSRKSQGARRQSVRVSECQSEPLRCSWQACHEGGKVRARSVCAQAPLSIRILVKAPGFASQSRRAWAVCSRG